MWLRPDPGLGCFPGQAKSHVLINAAKRLPQTLSNYSLDLQQLRFTLFTQGDGDLPASWSHTPNSPMEIVMLQSVKY